MDTRDARRQRPTITAKSLRWLLVFVLTIGSTPVEAAATPQTGPASIGRLVGEPSVSAVNATPAELDLLDRAIELFERQGLSLPSVTVIFGDTREVCSGYLGLFSRSEGPTIRICELRRWVVVHELAHVWTHANLTADQENEYLELRGLDEWNNHDLPWSERGFEDAAVVISQILIVGLGPAYSPAWQARREAFEFLTGTPAPD